VSVIGSEWRIACALANPTHPHNTRFDRAGSSKQKGDKADVNWQCINHWWRGNFNTFLKVQTSNNFLCTLVHNVNKEQSSPISADEENCKFRTCFLRLLTCLFILISSTILSVSQTTQRRLVVWLVNDEMWS